MPTNVNIPPKQPMSPLLKRRLVLGKTQGDIAKEARVTKAAMSLYENGQRRPHPKRIRDLAFALQLQPAELVELLSLI